MTAIRIPDALGGVALAAALGAATWTAIGPGQDGSLMARPGMLWVGALSCFGCLTLVFGNLLVVDDEDVPGRRTSRRSRRIGAWRDRFAEGERTAATSFERAGMAVRPAEYMVGGFSAIAAGAALAYFLLGVATAVVVAVTGVVVAAFWPRYRAARRTRQFNDQLPDALMIIASGLRSGQSLSRALDMLAKSGEPPISEELSRALVEARVGRLLVDALDDVAKRTKSDTFAWVAQAIVTNRQLGGNLAEILENAAATLRVREKINKKVRAVSAEGRMSAIVLISLPIVLALGIMRMNPSYMSPLWDDSTGRMMGLATVVLLVTGATWIRRMVNIEF